MQRKKILIAEDIHNVSVDIRHMLEEMGYQVQKIVGTGEEVLRVAEQSLPDLALVDVQLEGDLSGVEAATLLHELHGLPVVFMASAFPAPTVPAMVASEAYGLVIKPFRPEALKAAVELALHKHIPSGPGPLREGNCLFVRAEYRHNRIDFDRILYIEALKDYVVIHMLNGMVTTHSTIKGIEDALPEKDFVRIHRSYIVRIDKIHSIKYPELIMEGKMKVLPIGGLYKKRMFDRLNTLQ